MAAPGRDARAGTRIFLGDTERMAQQARQMRLASLGRLTASIAHEIRNPLGAISHACQLLSESAGIDAEDQRLLSIINTHSQRVNTIIESILEHSRPQQLLSEAFALKVWLELFVLRFTNSYSEKIQCTLTLDPDHIKLRFNQSQLEQLLTNLADNALRYSAQHSGTRSVAIKAYLNPLTQCPVIDVIDQGEGVSEQDAEQIFEPFFTTE